MKDHLNKLLEGATRDELLACIQLLALSVVQHRVKCGFVAFEQSMERLRSGTANDEETGLFVQGDDVLREALDMARGGFAKSGVEPVPAPAPEPEPEPGPVTEPAPEPAMEASPDDPLAENRMQLRINVTAPVKVLWPNDPKPVDARLENISWGGAAIQVQRAKADPGDNLQIILPSTQGGSISVEAKVLRSWALPNGRGHSLATRFSSLSTRDEAELENILELLAQSADTDGQRKHARLTQRLDIQFDGVQELLATLDDISAGGLGITVPKPLQIGQSCRR